MTLAVYRELKKKAFTRVRLNGRARIYGSVGWPAPKQGLQHVGASETQLCCPDGGPNVSSAGRLCGGNLAISRWGGASWPLAQERVEHLSRELPG